MSSLFHEHVPSEHLGVAASHNDLACLSAREREHLGACDRCQRLYAGYRLTDRLLAAPWRYASVPTATLEPIGERAGLRGLPAALRVRPRSLVPGLVAVGLVAAMALAVALPRMLPITASASSASPSSFPPRTASALPTPSHSPSGPAAPSSGPSSPPSQTAPSSGTGATTAPTAGPTPAPERPGQPTSIPSWPVAWAPDGGHFLVASSGAGWPSQKQIQIRDRNGRLTGSVNGVSAAWFTASSIAVLTPGGGRSPAASIDLVATNGRVTGTLPSLPDGGTPTSLMGSGSGELAIAETSRLGSRGSSSVFVVWNGRSFTVSSDGSPIGFSRDGGRLAVADSAGGTGSSGGLWVEVVSTSDLRSIATFQRLNLRLNLGGTLGERGDVTFSPSGNQLLVAGVLLDLGSGSATQTGEGGWAADGSLVTARNGSVLRWSNGRSAVDGRFAPGGNVAASTRGDILEYFGGPTAPVLVGADGQVHTLSIPGVASLGDVELAPNGGALAFTGQGSNNRLITAEVPLS